MAKEPRASVILVDMAWQPAIVMSLVGVDGEDVGDAQDRFSLFLTAFGVFFVDLIEHLSDELCLFLLGQMTPAGQRYERDLDLFGDLFESVRGRVFASPELKFECAIEPSTNGRLTGERSLNTVCSWPVFGSFDQVFFDRVLEEISKSFDLAFFVEDWGRLKGAMPHASWPVSESCRYFF